MLNSEFKKHLHNFEQDDHLIKCNNRIVEDGKIVKKVEQFFSEKGDEEFQNLIKKYENSIEYLDANKESNFVFKYLFGDKKMFVKMFENSIDDLSNEIIISKAFDKAGVNCLPVYPINLKPENIAAQQELEFLLSQLPIEMQNEIKKNLYVGQAIQDVNDLGFYDVTLARVLMLKHLEEMSEFNAQQLYRYKNNPIFYPIENKMIREYLLELMTEECLDEINTLYLLSAIWGNGDVHMGQFFFYKSNPNSQKFDGIIPIDNEVCYPVKLILDLKQDIDISNISVRDAFRIFLDVDYPMSTFINIKDENISHKSRISLLNNFIQSGKLKKSQIRTIKQFVEFNFEKEYKKLIDKYGFFPNKDYEEIIKRLSDYNERHLEL